MRMMRKAYVLALSGLLLATAEVPAAARPHGAASLLAAEDARFAAQISHADAAIAAGLGAELVYSHGNGRRQSRADYLAAFASGAIDYRRIEASDRIVHLYRDVGTTRATLTMQVGERRMRSSVAGVYVWRDRRWQLVSWQTTPLPDVP